jgi:hypothetical protein
MSYRTASDYFSLLCISPERDAVQAGPQAGGEPLPAGRPRRQSGQRGVSQALQEQSRFSHDH